MLKKPYLSTKIFSTKQESKIASELGWDTVSGSGARPCAPGDVISDSWLGECKTHVESSKTIHFNHEVWDKIKAESVSRHRKPVLFTDDGTQSLDCTWCVCLSNSIENQNIYVIPGTLSFKKNIGFDHLTQIADFKRTRRGTPEMFKGCAFVYSMKWNSDDIYLMPFESFKQIIQEQGS